MKVITNYYVKTLSLDSNIQSKSLNNTYINVIKILSFCSNIDSKSSIYFNISMM